MAKFKLYLLTFQNDINEKNQLSNKYLANLISEFTSQVSTKRIDGDSREHFIYNVNNNFCYTYEEQLSLHQNSQKELTFKMDFRVYHDDRLEDNPYAQNLIVGSQLLLEDAYGQQHLFTVKNINIELSNVNTVCTYSCQDSFTFQFSKQNDGYEITNSVDDEDFIGAHTIDWWVQKKIVPECFVYYDYITLADKGYIDDYYKQTIPFSGSGTADSILISLGETLDLNLHVYEHFDEKEGTLTQQFWFEPSKNPEVSGLSYSPYANLQSLSLTHKGDSLTSVLNVYGGTFGDERVTLLPTIPMLFKKVFASDEWMKTPYYQGMFNDIVYGQTIKINLDDIDDEFDYEIHNDYLKLNFTNVINITSLKWLSYYDYYKFANINNSAWATIGYSGKANYIINLAMTKQWLLGNKNTVYNSYEEFYKDFQKENKDLYLYIPISNTEVPNEYKEEDPTATFKTSLSGIFYLSLYRQPAEDETMFATVAEQCPWLENKLLDFSYFINHNLLNSYEYGILIQQIYNNLRQINGRLIYLADSYYKALSEKTKFLAQLDERVTNLGAKFTAEFLQPYLNQKQIREEDVQDFLLDYKTLYAVPEAKRAIFNYDEIYSDYINKYLNAEQRFLKNIYDFRDYWNAPVTIEGAQTIYCYTAYPASNYSFSENQKSTRDFKNYDESTLEPKTTIFNVNTNQPVDIVYSGNFNQFKWAKYAENTFVECSKMNKNNLYDKEKIYYKKVSITVGEGESSSAETTYQSLKLNELKINFLINVLGEEEENTNYYFKNREKYLYDFLNLNQICDFYDKFTSKALLKIVNYNLLSDQDDLTEKQVKEWLQETRTLDNRSLLGVKVYNYLYTTTFPVQEVYNYEDVYQLEGGRYVRQNIGKKYQAIPVVNASNYMNFYKRVSVSNEEYKTSQILATVTGVSTAVSFISACLGPVGWIVSGVGAITATVCGAIACSKISNQNTWWSNDGYTNKDITLSYTLPDQGLYNKLIQYDKIDYSNENAILNAEHFYYTTSEKDYDNYKVWNSQNYADLYFNKYSKFIPNYHYIQRHAQENRYMYKPSYLRLVKPDEYVNSADEYLMLIYDKNEKGDLHYFNGIFEDAFNSYLLGSEHNRLNNIHYSLFEQLSDSFSFNDFGDISNKTLKQVLEKQFVFDDSNTIEGQRFSLNLKGSTYYMVIFHKEDYMIKTIKKDSLEIDLTKYQYVFYSSKNDEAFNPNHVENFVDGLYLPASEDSLVPEDLEDAKAFDKERLYYKIENDKVVYYPTITQAIQQGSSYYYYTQSNNLIWRTEKLTETSIPLEVYDQTQMKFVSQDFIVLEKYNAENINKVVLSSMISLKDLTNGLFWNQYTNVSDKNLTFLKEHAMIIETDLTNYWNQAYNASQLCQYFLPEHWQSYYENQINPFVLFTQGEPETKTIAKADISALDFLEITLEEDDGSKPMTQEYLAKIYNNNKREGFPLYIFFHEGYYIVIYDEAAIEGQKYQTKSLDQNIVHLLFETYPNQEIAKIDYYWASEAMSFKPGSYPARSEYYQQQGFKLLKIPAETGETISYQVSTRLALNYQWIPEVEKVLNNQNPYTLKLKYFSDTSEYFDYISDYNQDLRDQNKNDDNYQIIPLRDFTHWEPFTSLIQKFNLDIDKWLLIPQYVSTQGTYFKRATGGTTWANLLQQLYPNKGSFPYFDGYYGLYMNYLKPENFIDGKMSEYDKYQEMHQKAWRDLYQQFPSILLEQKYQNEDATNSLELLQMAKLAMQDFNNIEREYNITTIDTFALKGYEGQQINIGDSIALNAEELYTGFDDIKESLKQYLFVTDISYTLRQDTDVNLTVNKIKYQDKMIQQLAKLIK